MRQFNSSLASVSDLLAGERESLRPLAERLITFAKRGDLHARRKVMTVVKDKGVVHRLFTEIAPDMAEREGGYTRITKIAPRKGDNAPMCVIELVREPVNAKPKRAVVAEAETIVVKSGDSLWKLANEYEVEGGWTALYEANKGAVSDAAVIYVGQELVLPQA